jgi:EEF1A lysine methyltransferase 2
MIASDSKHHWENIYSTKQENELGWYQIKAEISLSLISKYLPEKNKTIIDIGSGASVLIDDLLQEGYQQIYAADLSSAALEKSKQRLGNVKAERVTWIIDDVTSAKEIQKFENLQLWHDRAVFHFLLEEQQKQSYIKLLKSVLAVGGIAIIATFRTGGAKKCSGLDICQYDHHSLAQVFGSDFQLLEHLNYSHYNPKGEERPFVYAVFKRIN